MQPTNALLDAACALWICLDQQASPAQQYVWTKRSWHLIKSRLLPIINVLLIFKILPGVFYGFTHMLYSWWTPPCGPHAIPMVIESVHLETQQNILRSVPEECCSFLIELMNFWTELFVASHQPCWLRGQSSISLTSYNSTIELQQAPPHGPLEVQEYHRMNL